MAGEFEYKEYSGRGRVLTHTLISAAPTGFEKEVPYTLVVVELEGGGRLLGWLGESIAASDLAIDMEVQVVPRLFEEIEPIKVYYTIEKAGSTWSKAPA
jgi:uncharacterized OB-fold protein